jgi:tetratricopeptide (TPR) repeat protein
MMVRDEEAFLADALLSARPFCDELIVVDTGSTDRTVEIARDLGATVSHFPWCDDFSAARNETLRRATGRWIAVLDADERFRGPHPEAIRAHLRPGPQHPFEALLLDVVNVSLEGDVISSFFGVRLFPNDPRLGYTGRVHNRFGSLDPAHPTIAGTRYLGLDVVHLGYDRRVYAQRRKAERSLPLIRATVAERPHDHQYRYYLGRELFILGRLDEAVAELERAAADMRADPGHGLLQECTLTLLEAYAAAKAPLASALNAAQAALAIYPRNADLWHALALALIEPAPAEAAACLEQALAWLDHPDALHGQSALRGRAWQAREALGHLYWKLARYPDAYRAFLAALPDKPADGPGWPALLNCLCALAIELRDDARLPDLLDRLLDHPDAPLGMFFFAAERRPPDAARDLLARARARAPRVNADPEYAPLARRLGID